MRFAICDDEPTHIQVLEKYFTEQKEFDIKWDAYTKGEALLEDYIENNAPYDAIFLDLEMPGLNGLETANAIRAMDDRVFIIFVTSHSHHMEESFKCLPLRFLLKPIDPEKLKEAICTIAKKLEQEHIAINFSVDKGKIRLYCDDIIYCESDRHWVIIRTKDKNYRPRVALSKIEQLLPEEMFARCHQAFLINLRYVKEIRGDKLWVYGEEEPIPISRSFKPSFRLAVQKQKMRELWL